jgi:hypothetical protein
VEYSIRRLKPLLILLGSCGATEVAPFQSRHESRFSATYEVVAFPKGL